MAFNDPNLTHNPTTGTAIPAAWGDIVRDDLMALYGRPCVRVYKSGTQSILNNTLTKVTFDLELTDTHAAHSTSSNTDRITIPTSWGGSWMIGGTIYWATSTAGSRRHVEIGLNDALKIADSDNPATSSGWATQNVSCLWTGVAGDYFNLNVYQDTGGNLNVLNDGYAGTIFWAFFVGSGAG